MAEADPERDELELLATDFMQRLRRGEAPSIDAYAAAHPDLAEEIRDLFPTIAATEQLKTRRTHAGSTARWPATPPPAASPLLPDAGARPAAPGVGLTLGKYRLLERIGQGSLGTVWRSTHPELGIPLAVKVLRPELIGRSDAQVQRFLREARTAAQLNHPYVVRVFDAGCDQGLYFLVMEYVEGGSVGELLRQAGGKLGVARAVEIVTAMAEALHAAAEFGIVHRDIKPDNILLDRKGTPKLADLGLAKQLAVDDQPELTGTGVGLGTPLYVAPEQAMGEGTSDARADIYSLGATFYHLVTGAPPFTGATAYQIVHRHAHVPVVDPCTLNRDVSAELAAVIQRMLAKDPNDRYASARDLLDDLARLAAGLAPVPWHPRRGQTTWRWLVPAAAIAVIGFAAVLWIAVAQHGSGDAHVQVQAPLTAAPVEAARPPPVRPQAEDAGRPPPPEGVAGADGRVSVADWQLLEGSPREGVRPAPLRDHDYEFQDGVLRLLARPGRRPATLVYEPAIPAGAVAVVIEAKNLAECAFLEPAGEPAGCRIVFRDPAAPPAAAASWQTIEIRRAHGELTCTVDGQPAYAVERPQATRGRLVIPLPPAGACEIRRFAVVPGDFPAKPPPRRNPNPPPH